MPASAKSGLNVEKIFKELATRMPKQAAAPQADTVRMMLLRFFFPQITRRVLPTQTRALTPQVILLPSKKESSCAC